MSTAVTHAPVFEINDLNLWYGDHHALKNINFPINRNEVTAIIGPSGCGKSTFIKTLNLMINMVPNVKMSGEINYKSKNIINKKIDLVDLRKNVGMVFQKGNPFPQTIFENIAYGPRIHGEKRKKVLEEIVEKSLRDVALWDEVKDRLHTPAMGLSGGQQQRLCIARALATKPDVLLMDEPTSALDPISTLKIEELMLELKEKYTIVVVTHNMQQAARVSDKTAFFLMGELVEIDETSKIFSRPADQRTEDYISGRFG
ncbi:phosphate ABC transporter ATP-binding protein PstB [Niallia taxi]|uniref:Phosphate ABC transporter ATP-binding protein n=1 Tax=Niallia taxi TaxID=2499688 RepID=A0A3S2TSB3_9BACI|nr:phosphate ABC transporter ATP-binding protein PstB [Niallia taxi]MCM3217448.1 phosphate ABC transporter ATP-binding protein PstB [Niallia taxi]MDK8641357.1 phosphate ABC transporter ATP-binding protein PstB [Niallia taxi]MED4055681.1 phosphate ABC transporter ATP-binding protein PstB [Niallia taxi]MED4121343.1 phosphate ABC transporter ATP-binding protein PstB [Niallia taxi]RVT59143.1 phosphate ABC transporter ATP-binding protein [Niallia taxi]